MTTAEAPPNRLCKGCSRPYATYVLRPCQGDFCIDCAIFDPAESHWEMERDVDLVASYKCPHGVEYVELCRGCGAKVGAWGVGAAGFGELCGCEVKR